MKLTCPFMDEYVDSFSYSKNVELHVPHSRACQLEVSIMELHGFCGVKVSKTSGNIIKIIPQTHVFEPYRGVQVSHTFMYQGIHTAGYFVNDLHITYN